MSLEEEIGAYLIKNNLTISTAESCTGGLLSSKLTDVAGSSAYIKFNVVTYANEIKHSILKVSNETLNTKGAVSPECAKEMVIGLKELTNADICVATTGIAGPGGGSKDKPVGLCYISTLYKNNILIEKIILNSDIQRIKMKEEFAKMALLLIKKTLHL